MSADLEELQKWGEVIEQAANDLGLDLYPQEFECEYDQESFLALVSHQALESVFMDWHFGREFDKLKTMSEWGMQRYAEVAVNIHPCRAYLLMTNPLPLQILVMAHVYGHNNVFKVNNRLSSANPDKIVDMLKTDSALIEEVRSRDGVDPDEINALIDAARYLRWHKERSDYDCFEEDILKVIEREAPLSSAEESIVRAIRRWSDYLYQQMVTKLINEGWATFMEWEILKRVNEIEPIPKSLFNECRQQHLKLIGTPTRWTHFLRSPSPYFLGYHICKFWADELGIEKASERLQDMDDDTLLDEYWHPKIEETIIDKIDENVIAELDDMEEEEVQMEQQARMLVEKMGIRKLIRNHFGSRQIPWIVNIGYEKKRSGTKDFELRHIFRGRTLNLGLAKETVEAIRKHLWKVEIGRVILYTRVEVPVEDDNSDDEEEKTEYHFARITCRRPNREAEIEVSKEPFKAIKL